MQLKRGRGVFGIAGALALTAAVVGATLPAMAAPADSPHPAGGLAVDPDLSVAPGYSAPRTSARIFRAASIPASVDLTAFAPPVGDQGADGACASWGIGYTTMGWWARKAGDTKLFAPMYLYSQAHLSNETDGGGSYPSTNYSILQNQGIDTQNDWTGDSTTFTRTPNAAEQTAAAQFETGTYHRLFYSGQAQNGVGTGAETAIKQALANGYPVGLGIPIYDAFYYLNSNDSTYLLSDPNSTTDYEGGHYVIALGYNSTGVIIENSWGTDWGDEGFATIGWDFINAKAIEGEYMEGPLEYTTAQRAPSAITNLTSPSQDSTSVDLSWTAPADSGSTPISSYTLTTSGGGNTSTIMLAGGATTAHVGNLSPSTGYTFTLAAANTLSLISPTASTSSSTGAAPVPVVQPTVDATPGLTTTPAAAPTASTSSTETVTTPVAPVQDLIPTEPVVSNPTTTDPTPSTPVAPVVPKPRAPKPAAKAPILGKLAMHVSRTTVKLVWTAANASSGKITRYQVVVEYKGKVVQNHTYRATARKTTLTNLKPVRRYDLTVYAYNSAGKATRSSRTIQMG